MTAENDDLKVMSNAEFHQLGFVQEINRRLLHPCGLALSVSYDDDGNATLGQIWDYRDDPEGNAYGPGMIDPVKAANVDALLADHADARQATLGYIIQPVDQPYSA